MKMKKLYIGIIAIGIISAGGILGIIAVVHLINTTTYEVTFTAIWSNATHPDSNFPSNPHFSKLIGATHNNKDALWKPGEKSSDGIESMAETGGTDKLTEEINNLIVVGKAFSVIFEDDGNIADTPGCAKISFTIHTSFKYVSLVTMIAPSPDWFVGVNSINLLNSDGTWKEKLVVELYAYDSGTDNGNTFNSEDSDTSPADDIALITVTPFPTGGAPIGTFTFIKK